MAALHAAVIPPPAQAQAEAQDSSTSLSSIVPPKPLSPLTLSYPPNRRGNHHVVLELLVSPSGEVEKVTVIRGEAPFTELAEKAAARWIFTPAMSGGEAVAARIQVEAKFEQEKPHDTALPPPAPEKTSQETHAPASDIPEIEVRVYGERQPSPTYLDRTEVRVLPGAFGDPFRAIEALPGVTPMISGLPYYYVRGAPPGDVGYYFAGVPVPALYHIGVGPGVLHPAFVERVVLHAGAYPVNLGRHSGGILLGELAAPRYEKRGEFGVRLTETSAMLEAPLPARNGSVMLGGRYGYPGLALSLIEPDVDVSYWDYQALFNYELSSTSQLDVLVFGASDYIGHKVKLMDENGDPSGKTRWDTALLSRFHRLDLRWTENGEERQSFAAATVGLDASDIGEFSSARSFLFGVRGHHAWKLAPQLALRVGVDASANLRRIRVDDDDNDGGGSAISPTAPTSELPGEAFMRPIWVSGSSTSAGETSRRDHAASQEPSKSEDDFASEAKAAIVGRREDYVFGAYANLDWDLSQDLRFSPGLRLDAYVSGSDAALAVEPRLKLSYQLSPSFSIHNAFGLAHQMPAFFVPVPGVHPSLKGGLQRSVQHSAGVEWAWPGGFQSSATLFHNLFFNVSDPVSVTRYNESVDNPGSPWLARAQGRSVGLELMIRRSLARDLGGMLSYTWSRSTRSQGYASGPALFDRTHILNLALTKDLGRNWHFNSRLLFYTGVPATVAYLAAAKAPPRLSPFWRLDWRLEKRWVMDTPGSYWAFIAEVLNTTLQKEPLEGSCHAFACSEQTEGPITVPNIGVEAKF